MEKVLKVELFFDILSTSNAVIFTRNLANDSVLFLAGQ